MRLGIIDLGTNSVRFDVRELTSKKKKTLHSERIMVRLGQGFFLKGELDPQAVDRTAKALTHFHEVAQEFNVGKIVAFGTATLREAPDADKTIAEIQKKSGIKVRVISGEEEARLIALGVLSNEKTPNSRFAVVDIGGGSMEVSICKDRKSEICDSFPLGAARLQQIFLKRSPPRPEAIQALREHIRAIMLEEGKEHKWPKVKTIVGSSGTIKALGRMLRKRGAKPGFTKDQLSELVRKMSTMTTMELLGMPGLESKRVDMILAGALLLEEAMRFLGAIRVIPTEFSLRDGILIEESRLFLEEGSSHLKPHEGAIFIKASRFGVSDDYIKTMSKFTEKLFDGLRRVHRLDSTWKFHLVAATMLRRVGMLVSPLNFERHSYYIVKNAEFPSMEPWESELIAQLCLHHGESKFEPKDIPYKKGHPLRPIYPRILSLLRVIEAFDARVNSYPVLKRIEMLRGQILFHCTVENPTGLESVRLERKKELFVKIYGKNISCKIR